LYSQSKWRRIDGICCLAANGLYYKDNQNAAMNRAKKHGCFWYFDGKCYKVDGKCLLTLPKFALV
jgi:hypothetical protein